MAGFDAGEVIEPMDWDFTRYKAGKGTVPEPSDVETERFLRKWRLLVVQVVSAAEIAANEMIDQEIEQRKQEALARVEGKPIKVPTIAEALELMKQVDVSDTAPEIADAMADLVSKFCKNKPSKAQLLKLPNRIRGAFYGWLIGQVTNPEFSAVVTKPTLSLVNGG